MEIIKYKNEEEKQNIIQTKTTQGLVLVEIANLTDGNFLGFMAQSDIPEPKTPIEQRLDAIEAKLDQLAQKVVTV